MRMPILPIMALPHVFRGGEMNAFDATNIGELVSLTNRIHLKLSPSRNDQIYSHMSNPYIYSISNRTK